MKIIYLYVHIIFICLCVIFSCSEKKSAYSSNYKMQQLIGIKSNSEVDTSILQDEQLNPFIEVNQVINDVVLYDKFNPPVASRIFAYTNLTAHLILAKFGLLNSPKTILQINKIVESKYDSSFIFAVALTAQKKVAKNLVWSSSKIENGFNSIIYKWTINNNLQTSKHEIDSLGNLLADEIISYSLQDGYSKRLANKRYEVLYDDEKAWKPTAPSFALPVEPYWKEVKTFLISDRKPYMIKIPFDFSSSPDADFYRFNNDLYIKSVNLTDTEKIIAKHWDCNPIQTKNVGHVMLFSFRQTPAAHWISIVSAIVKNSKMNTVKTVELYSYLSMSMADAFIICWDIKYQNNFIRPETYINKYIKKEWRPFIETPSFPEYPSGHSLVSTAAAQICNYFLGENYSFTDSTQQLFGLPIRYFNNFNEAANEAGVSRYYGGIHYMKSIETGSLIGKQIGTLVVKNTPK